MPDAGTGNPGRLDALFIGAKYEQHDSDISSGYGADGDAAVNLYASYTLGNNTLKAMIDGYEVAEDSITLKFLASAEEVTDDTDGDGIADGVIVAETYEDTVNRTNGEVSLRLSAAKERDANTVITVHELLDRMTELEKELGSIKFDVVFEQASFIEESISGVAREGGLGAIFAVIVIGAKSIIDRVNANRIRLLADLRGRGGGPQRIGLQAIIAGLPASAPIKVRCDPESVTVRLQ